MLTVTRALIDYWLGLPRTAPAARRRDLEAAIDRTRSGADGRESLLPYALCDVEEGIVARATRGYVEAATRDRNAAVHEATEWIRRHLALNRGAVFAALLDLDDEFATAMLAPLRLRLEEAEVETACRRLEVRPGGGIAAFLREWHGLLEGEGRQAERRHVGAALAAACARAA
jgi:hypothetical protein